MHYLEKRLHARDFDLRVTHPFEWGLEFLNDPVLLETSDWQNNHFSITSRSEAVSVNGIQSPLKVISEFNAEHLPNGEAFFSPSPSRASDFKLSADESGLNWLSFPSSVNTPYENNNLVHARFFPAGAGDTAVIVSPQWNAQADSHIALCRALNHFGISALRMSLPYHDKRLPDGFTRADYMVSANVGRTIQAVRQSVLDIRRAADWLFAAGYKRVGLIGTSIGSCVSWLAFIHDPRFEAGVFNMVSSWFGDVVWRALTTTHIRRALESELTAEQAREVWKTISPAAYTDSLPGLRRPFLCISASYDLTFLPDLAQIFFDACRQHNVPAEIKFLPCGHYTIGRTPFKYLDAYHMVNFFRRLWC